MKPDDYPKVWPKQFPKSLTIPQTTLWYNLEVAAARYPDKAATIFYDSRLGYAALARQAERLAGFLQQRCGVRKGDRVLLNMQNSPQFIIAYYAILRADAVVVPVSPMNVTDELEHYIADSGATTGIVAQELYPRLRPLIGRTLTHAIVATYSEYLAAPTSLTLPDFVTVPATQMLDPGAVGWKDALTAAYEPRAAQANASDLCAILYTSGTTGKPKGCMHTHGTLMFTAVGGAIWEGMAADSVVLDTAPLFHVTGMQHSMNAPVFAGATITLLPRWDPEVAAYMIERYGCTHWANVPTMVVDLLAHPATAARDLASLQNVFGGGASMPEAVAQKLFDLCGIQYMEAYGMTETISQTHTNPPQLAKQQCLGIPVFDTESVVVDPETFRVLGPGEQGEIVVRGPQLLKGYWGNEKAFRESWCEVEGKAFFRTGDLGRTDEDGFFYISDRLKRMINVAGFKVWPAEVEAAMYQHPAIKECCIIAAPDARRGETVKAVVVLKDGHASVTGEQILDWARTRMAAYKVPRLIEFSAALPRTPSGKLMWRALQEAQFNWGQAPISRIREIGACPPKVPRDT